MLSNKLYCYIDETGQDTNGKLFIVSVIVAGNNKQEIEKELEKIEYKSNKNKSKWTSSKKCINKKYINLVFSSNLEIRLYYNIYHSTKDYLALTILTIAKALKKTNDDQKKYVVIIDALPKSKQRFVGSQLRHLDIRTGPYNKLCLIKGTGKI